MEKDLIRNFLNAVTSEEVVVQSNKAEDMDDKKKKELEDAAKAEATAKEEAAKADKVEDKDTKKEDVMKAEDTDMAEKAKKKEEKVEPYVEVAKAEKKDDDDMDDEDVAKAMKTYEEDCAKAMPAALAAALAKKGMKASMKAIPVEDTGNSDNEKQMNKAEEISLDAIRQSAESLIAAVRPMLEESYARVEQLIANQTVAFASVQTEVEVLKSQTVSVGEFQTLSIPILTQLKSAIEQTASEVKDLGNASQTRRSLVSEQQVNKSATVSQSNIVNLTPLEDWARKNYSVPERIAIYRSAEAGDFSQVPENIQKLMGVK